MPLSCFRTACGYTLIMVEVSFGEHGIRLEPRGLDKLWAFKNDLTFAYSNISRIFADPQPGFGRNWWEVIRSPGTSVPGIVQAGTFYWRGEGEFWCIHYTGKSVVFELENLRYSRVVVDVRDPEAVVQRVRAAR